MHKILVRVQFLFKSISIHFLFRNGIPINSLSKNDISIQFFPKNGLSIHFLPKRSISQFLPFREYFSVSLHINFNLALVHKHTYAQ